MVAAGTIAAADLNLLCVTDDLDVAMPYIEQHAVRAFGLRRRVPAPSIFLGEHKTGGAPA